MSQPHYNVKEIAALLEVSYDRLRKYTDQERIRERLGAVYGLPGSKGPQYPESAVALLRVVLDQADKRLIQPATAAAWLETYRPAEGLMIHGATEPTAQTAIAPTDQQANEPLSRQADWTEAALSATDRLVHALELQAINHKSVLTRADVCLMLDISPTVLREYGPKPSFRIGESARGDRWRRRDVMRWEP